MVATGGCERAAGDRQCPFYTRQNKFLNGQCREVCQQARHRTLADLKLEPESAEDEGDALKNKLGLRPISAVQEAAEWERSTKKVDAGRAPPAWCG